MVAMIEAIQDVVGPEGILVGDEVFQKPGGAWSEGHCHARTIVRPANTENCLEFSRTLEDILDDYERVSSDLIRKVTSL